MCSLQAGVICFVLLDLLVKLIAESFSCCTAFQAGFGGFQLRYRMKPALDRIRHSRLQHRTFLSRFGIQPLDELCALLALNTFDSYCLICRRFCIGGFGMVQVR